MLKYTYNIGIHYVHKSLKIIYIFILQFKNGAHVVQIII